MKSVDSPAGWNIHPAAFFIPKNIYKIAYQGNFISFYEGLYGSFCDGESGLDKSGKML